MNGLPVLLSAIAALMVGTVIGVHLGRLRWYGRCGECRYKLGHRLTEFARAEHHIRQVR